MIVTPRTEGAQNMLVHLDGVDVTDDCTAVAVAEGWVEMFVRDVNGAVILYADRFLTARRYGIVSLSTRTLRPDLPRAVPPNPQGEAKERKASDP